MFGVWWALIRAFIQDDGSSGADTEEETDDTTPSSGSVTVLSEKTLDNGQKVCSMSIHNNLLCNALCCFLSYLSEAKQS